MLQHLIASAIFWLVVTRILAIAGPSAIGAWLLVAVPWGIASKRRLFPATSCAEVVVAMVPLQVGLDAYWPYGGDLVFCVVGWTSITALVRSNTFPRARVRRHR